jgi:alkanesulfonate monooxygenase SsuD/methylene tetrahydromethanopterin reductase-like flavin-dependent oxidoreductase (luciferase family)
MIGFGAQLSLHPPAEQFELVQRLEAVGYDSVWTGDHMSFHNPIHESITLLASYVPITVKIRRSSSSAAFPTRSAAPA